MKQLQVVFETEDEFESSMNQIREWVNNIHYASAFIQIYSGKVDLEKIKGVSDVCLAIIPGAFILGCSTNGNISSGTFAGNSFVVICSCFEYSTTKLASLSYSFGELSLGEVAEQICREAQERPWVQGVLMLSTIRGRSMTELCDGLSLLPEGIQVFGGGAFSTEADRDRACVFTNDIRMENGIVILLLGGDDLHIRTSYVTGWKPLGPRLQVTASDGFLLKELNHKPAYDTYYKYLHIENDDFFFNNTREFPLLYRHNGIDLLRAPIKSNPDGSLVLTSGVEENVQARLAYGDPWTILVAAYEEGRQLYSFAPDLITVFSCAGRRSFWGNSEVGKETAVYQLVAPTGGFYTSGEFLRTNGFVNQHNVTQVIVAFREGEKKALSSKLFEEEKKKLRGKVPMINRMATFIKTTTEELEEANRKLREMAVRDTSTGVWNKNAYFSRVNELNETHLDFSVAVFDMNGLKEINDTYGHQIGDLAIRDAVQVIESVFGKGNVYRIGGDEFIAVIEKADGPEMERNFTRMKKAIDDCNQSTRDYQFPLSLSMGYSVFDPSCDEDYQSVFRRADKNMYANKAAYYKTHKKNTAK